MMLKAIVQSLAFIPLAALALFVPAGTLDWTQGWIFLGLFVVLSQAMGFWLLRTNPELLRQRMKSPFAASQKPRDRVVVAAIFLAMAAWIVFIGLDARRFQWSHVPPWLEGVGAALIILAFYLWGLVLRANPFAATTIEVQRDLGQSVISTGPYAIVRHPMYADTVFFFVGTALLLGSLWGLLFAALVFPPLLVLRIGGEEAILMEGLPGYRDYAAKVRYRLVPGVW